MYLWLPGPGVKGSPSSPSIPLSLLDFANTVHFNILSRLRQRYKQLTTYQLALVSKQVTMYTVLLRTTWTLNARSKGQGLNVCTRFAAFEFHVIIRWSKRISVYELGYCSLLLLLCERKSMTFSKDNTRYEYDVFLGSKLCLLVPLFWFKFRIAWIYKSCICFEVLWCCALFAITKTSQKKYWLWITKANALSKMHGPFALAKTR